MDNNKLKEIICESGLKQFEFANRIGYTESYISKIISGTSPFTRNVKTIIHEEFGYDIESMSDTSDKLKDKAVTFYEYFEEIFKEITTTPKKYRDINDNNEKFLRLNMNKHLYNFFVNIDLAKERKEQGSPCFEKEFEEFRLKYLESKEDYQDYILIPCNSLLKIVQEEEQTRKSFDECINLTNELEDYLDQEQIEQLEKQKAAGN